MGRSNETPPFWFIHDGKRVEGHPERPHERDTRFLESDGFKRNLEQMKLEWVWWGWYTGEARARIRQSLTNPKELIKALMNLDVESHRCAPFLWAHIRWYSLGLLAAAAAFATGALL